MPISNENPLKSSNARNAYTQFRDGNISMNELVDNWEYWFGILVTRPYDEIFALLMENWAAKRGGYAIYIECFYGDQIDECILIFEKEGLFNART